MSLNRDVVALKILDNQLYIIAGRNDNIEYITQVESIDLKTKKLRKLKNCIAPAGQACLANVDDRYIYKFGGWKKRYVPNDIIQRYDVL